MPYFPTVSVSRSAVFGALLALATARLTAQVFVGSDNFNDNTLTIQGASNQAAGQYRFSTPNANGTGNAWTETGQQLQYTTSNTSAFNRGFLGWVSPSTSFNGTPSGTNLGIGGTGLTTGAPYTSNWVATIQVTNNVTVASGFSSAGFEIYTTNTTNTASNGYYGINITQQSGGAFIDVEWGKWNGTTFDSTPSYIALDTTANVVLRMSYDGTTKVLTADFSKDGGINYLSGGSFALAGAQAGATAPYMDGFGLEFYASASAGNAINAGQIAFDNFAVTAIPEPATSVLLAAAGAMGLALWRRRRMRAA